MLDTLLQISRVARRQLLRKPVLILTISAILSLAVGTSTAVFAVLDAVVLSAMPYPEADALVEIRCRPEAGKPPGNCPVAALVALRDSSRSVSELGYHGLGTARIDRGAVLEPFAARKVSSSFFSTLGIKPSRGRWFLAADNQHGACLAVISDRAWRDLFARAETAVGSSIILPPRTCEVVGVMPPEFSFPESRFLAWTLDPLTIARMQQQSMSDSLGVARLSSQVTPAQFGAELAAVAEQLAASGSIAAGMTFEAQPLRRVILKDNAAIIWFLLASSCLLLGIVIANVISLLATQSIETWPAQMIRLSLGATRRQLRIQRLAECLPAAPLAAVGALLLAAGLLRVFEQLSGGGLSRAEFARLDGLTVLYACALSTCSLVVAGLFGFVPATDGAQETVARSTLMASDRTPQVRNLRRVSMAVQIGLGFFLVLLAGSAVGLLKQATGIPLGFDPKGLVAVAVDGQREGPAASQLLEQVSQLPFVRHAAAASSLPLASSVTTNGLSHALDGQAEWQSGPAAQYKSVTPAYFGVVGIPLISGRALSEADVLGSPCAAVVSAALASAFGGPDRSLRTDVMAPGRARAHCRIVGVVADVRDSRIKEGAMPQVYFAFAQQQPPDLAIVARTTNAVGAIRAITALASMSGGQLKIRSVVNAEEFIAAVTRRERTLSYEVLLFSICGYAVAILGILASTAAALNERRRELAMRVALGAPRLSIVLLTLRSYLGTVAVGIVLGGAAYASLRPLHLQWLAGMTPGSTGSIALTGCAVLTFAALVGLLPLSRLRSKDLVTELKAR